MRRAPLALVVLLSFSLTPIAVSGQPLGQVVENRYGQMWPNVAPWVHAEINVAENVTVNSYTCEDHTKYCPIYSAYPINGLGEVVAAYTPDEKGVSVSIVRYDEAKIPVTVISAENVSAVGVAASEPVVMQSSLSNTEAEEIPILVAYSSGDYVYMVPVEARVLTGTGYPYPVLHQSAVMSPGSLQVSVGGTATEIKVLLIDSSTSSSGVTDTYLIMYDVNGKLGWTLLDVNYPYSGTPVISNSVSGWIEEDSGIQDFDVHVLKSPLVGLAFVGYHKGTYGVWFKTLKASTGGLEILYTALLESSPYCPSEGSSISFASYPSSDGSEIYCLVAWLEVQGLNTPVYNTLIQNFVSYQSSSTSPPPIPAVMARYLIVSAQSGTITVLPFYSGSQEFDVPILVYFRVYGKWSQTSTTQVSITLEGADDISSVDVVYNQNASVMKFLILISSDVKPYYSLDYFLELEPTTDFGYDVLAIPMPGLEWYESNKSVPIAGAVALYTFYNNNYGIIRTVVNMNSSESFDPTNDAYKFSDIIAIAGSYDPIFDFDVLMYYKDNKGNNRDQIGQIGVTTTVNIGGKQVQLLMLNFANSTSEGWNICELTTVPLVGQLQYLYGSSSTTLKVGTDFMSDEGTMLMRPVIVLEETSHPSSVNLGTLTSEVDVVVSTVPSPRVPGWTPGSNYSVYLFATAPADYATAFLTGETACDTAVDLTVKFPAMPTTGDVFTRVAEWLTTFVSDNGTPSSPIVATGSGFQFTFLDTLASLSQQLSSKDINALKTLVGVLNSNWTFDLFVGPSGFGYPSTLVQQVLGDWNASPPYVDFDPALVLNTVLPALWQAPVLQVFTVSFTANLSNLVVEATTELATSTTTSGGTSAPSTYSYPVPTPSTSTGTSATGVQPPTTEESVTSGTTSTTSSGTTSTVTTIPCPVPVPRRRAGGKGPSRPSP